MINYHYYALDNLIDFRHSYSPKPENFDVHFHSRYELFYFLSGDVTYYIEGQAYKIQPHDILMINTRELHRPVFESDTPYERLVIHFRGDYISSLQSLQYDLLACFDKRKLGYFNKINAKDVLDNNVNHYFNLMEDYVRSSLPEKDVMIKTYFVQLLVALNKIFAETGDLYHSPYGYDQKVMAIVDYINLHLHEKITLDLLEQEFYVNKYYLCHIFKRHTGFAVMEFITYKRIMTAKELLAAGIPVIETCHSVGFNDYSNFYKTFKKLTGFSPKTYSKSGK